MARRVFVASLRIAGILALLALGDARRVVAAPSEPRVVGVLGTAGPDLDAAAAGARAATFGRPDTAVEVADDGGSESGLADAVRRLRARKVDAVVALPSAALEAAHRKAARGFRVPWLFVVSMTPDARDDVGTVRFLAPSLAGQALFAADAMLAPLAARRVAVVHEATERGRSLAAGFTRNLSERITLVGTREWDASSGARVVAALKTLEVDWVYAAVTGPHAEAFARAMRESAYRPRCLFADGGRNERWLGEGTPLAECVFLDGPDVELTGRAGERLADRVAQAGAPLDAVTVRAFEATRRALEALDRTRSHRAGAMEEALTATEGTSGVLGPVGFEPHRGIRFFPFTLWRVASGRFAPWSPALLPAPGCGPPLGFRTPEPPEVGDRGKVGYVTYGEAAEAKDRMPGTPERTIEANLLAIGLSTGGAEPALDAFLREEVLGRAVRIAYRLFRREADGSGIPGWSWGMALTTRPPSEDLPHSKTWRAVVAGDHPDAGGQVIGSGLVAVYGTFLVRTMYLSKRLDPPVSRADRVLLDGTYRWGEDRASNRRADEIRCLLDGFASAVGMTLSHEFGHLCGCGHDTEKPTSIMNVVAGAGASWEEAVWIPSHARMVTTTLGLEGVDR